MPLGFEIGQAVTVNFGHRRGFTDQKPGIVVEYPPGKLSRKIVAIELDRQVSAIDPEAVAAALGTSVTATETILTS